MARRRRSPEYADVGAARQRPQMSRLEHELRRTALAVTASTLVVGEKETVPTLQSVAGGGGTPPPCAQHGNGILTTGTQRQADHSD